MNRTGTARPVIFCAVASFVVMTSYAAFTVVKKPVGPNVNTAIRETGPVVSPDGQLLYFTREEKGKVQHVYVSRRQRDGSWGPATMLPAPLNNEYPSFIMAALPDNNTLLIGGRFAAPKPEKKSSVIDDLFGTMKGNDGEKPSPPVGIALTRRTATGWSAPEVLKLAFKDTGPRSYFTLAPNGQVLLLSITPEGGVGKRDILVSLKQKDGSWSQPRVIGPPINSTAFETTMFIAPDNTTMYFSSSREGGLGSGDIYMARRLDDTWLRWSAPVNLGAEVNGPDYDGSLSVDASGNFAFMSSGPPWQEDIFTFELPPNMKPQVIAFVNGRVLDARGMPVAALISYERLADGKEAGNAYTNPQTGEYQIALPAGQEYSFRATAPGFLASSERVDLTAAKAQQTIRTDMKMVPIAVGSTIRLNNIFFDSAKAVLLPKSRVELDRVVTILRENPTIHIEMSGHTDAEGDDASNMKLSKARADAVVTYLVQQGIVAARLRGAGYGETRPVAGNNTPEGRQLNRRVEFTITKT